jgi:hypothetical protein
MTLDNLRAAIVKEFADKWELNDLAHRQTHFEGVFRTGMLINERLGLGFDPKLILFAAYFHDMFAWSRVNHHELSFHWMMSTDHPLILEHFDPSETQQVAWACMQHRASFTGQFKSQFAELINAADRELPGNVDVMLLRAMQFRQKKAPHESAVQIMEASIAHLKEKFGFGGYARYPALYIECFDRELDKQRREIAQL